MRYSCMFFPQLERQNSKSAIRYAWKVIGTIVLEARKQSLFSDGMKMNNVNYGVAE